MSRPAKTLQQKARAHTDTAMNVVVGVLTSPKSPDAVRLKAAEMLWQRGWGMPAQVIAGDEDRPLRVEHDGETVRRLAYLLMSQGAPKQLEVLDVEHAKVEQEQGDNG